MTRWLGGKSVLIVEDEFLIGLLLIKEITGVGGTSLGPVTSVADALKEIESRPVDAVILDAKLVDGSAADLAACLDARAIPYVVVSGYDKENLPIGLRRAPFVAKPILMPVLMEAIKGLPVASERDSSRQLIADQLATPNHCPRSEERSAVARCEKRSIMPSPGKGQT